MENVGSIGYENHILVQHVCNVVNIVVIAGQTCQENLKAIIKLSYYQQLDGSSH